MHTPGRFQRSRFALVTWGHFLNDCYGSFFAPILPLLIDKLSLSLSMASGLAAIGSITSAVFQPIYDIASDRVHGRLCFVLRPLLSIVCMSLIGVAPNALLVGDLLLLAGIGSAAFHPQAGAAAGVLSGERRAFGISLSSCFTKPSRKASPERSTGQRLSAAKAWRLALWQPKGVDSGVVRR